LGRLRKYEQSLAGLLSYYKDGYIGINKIL
jgi:preprotein translocase subunit Sec61beta